MKYSQNNKPIICMMTNSTCYKGTKIFAPKGVLWHSTGACNPRISRYVQPSENDSNYDNLIKLLGKNNNKNDWNHQYVEAGLNAWIGKLADGTVAAVQTMPLNYRPWGCGSGSKGSCNNTHVQFECCEDSLNDKSYFDKVYKEACEFTAYICKMYNLDPHGYTTVNGVKCPVITCHAESAKLGLGSNHADILHWFNKYGKTMDDVRNDVAKLMGKVSATSATTTQSSTSSSFAVGDEVKLVAGATYTSGKKIPVWVFNAKLYVRQVNGDNVIISTLQTGAITGTVNKKYLTTYGDVKPYKVKVTTDALNIRAGAGTTYSVVGCIRDQGVYTIIEEKNGWGRLKSKAGWISLQYTEKI